MRIYWTCQYSKCTHKNEITSHLVEHLIHTHNGIKYELDSFKKEKKAPDSIRKLKKEVWDLFSEYVRRSEADANGYCRCVSCGTIRRWQDCDAGHYVHGTAFLIRELVHAQCKPCNSYGHGNLAAYKEFMLKKYGQKTLDKLEFLAKRPHVYTVFELNQAKMMYQEKLKKIV